MKYLLILFNLLTCHIYLTTEVLIGSFKLSSNCPKIIIPHGYTRIKRTNVVRINCYKGYLLFGPRTLSCYAGKWNYDFPKCIKSPGCNKLKSPDNGLIWPYEDGTTVGFVCYPSYVLVGSASLICSNGNWNATAPRCLKPGSLECNFDSDNDPVCGWIQDASDSWQRVKNPSGGGYISVVTTNVSRIISPLIVTSKEKRCFLFSRKHDSETFVRIYLSIDTNSTITYTPISIWETTTYELPPTNETHCELIIEATGTGRVNLDNFLIIDYESCNSIANTEIPSTDIAPERDNQSCRYRCTNADALTVEPDYFTSTLSLDTTQTDEPIFIQCDCDPSCTETSTCCRDFDHYCIARERLNSNIVNSTTTISPTKIITTKSINTTPILLSTASTFISSTKIEIPITSLKPGPTTKLFPITTKSTTKNIQTTITTTSRPKFTTNNIQITKTTTTSRPKSTTKNIQTTKTTTTSGPKSTTKNIQTTKTTTTNRPKSTKKIIPTTIKTSRKPTTDITTKAFNPITSTINTLKKETVLSTTTKVTYTEEISIGTTPSYHTKELTSKNNDKEPFFSKISLISIIVGSITIILFTILGIWFIYRRRRIYINRQVNNLAEDSDVRFLTGDEILDFTLQRPEPDDMDF